MTGQRHWSESQMLHEHVSTGGRVAILITYQKCAEHVKTDEIDNGKVAPAGVLLPGVVIGLGVTELSREAGQHDFLPGLPRRTPFLD